MNRNNNSKPADPKQAPPTRLKQPAAAAASTYIPSSVCCPAVPDPFGRGEKCRQQQQQSSSSRRRCDDSLLQLRSSLFDSPPFEWLDRQRNNNSGESSSRKLASKETCRRDVENWCHMHFRFRMEGYRSLVYAVKQSSKDESLFTEEHLDKWTVKMKFRIRKASPLKTALLACTSRLGLENDPDVIFCTDGFYGDALTGRTSSKNEVANRVVQATSTCRAMGLANATCLFVSRVTRAERENANMQVQLDFMRGAEASSSGGRRSTEDMDDDSAMSEFQHYDELRAPSTYSVGRDVSSRDLILEDN